MVGHAEQWMVLRAGGVVHVGRLAVEHCATTQARGPTAPVQAGDPIVLRNCQTGGILAAVVLSLTEKDRPVEWQLVMDSYGANRIRHGVSADPTLLGRLQRHDRLVPSAAETFYSYHRWYCPRRCGSVVAEPEAATNASFCPGPTC